MKLSIFPLLIFMAGVSPSIAQSVSFQRLEAKFSSCQNVQSFKTSGLFALAILGLAGEHNFNRAIKSLKHIYLINIPKSAFDDRGVSLSGFKKILVDDAYQEVASVRDGRNRLVIYHQPAGHSSQRYLILMDNPDKVVAVEIKGYLDAHLLNTKS